MVVLPRGLTCGAVVMPRLIYEVGRWMTWFAISVRHGEWRLVYREHQLYPDVRIDEVRHNAHSPIVIGQRQQIDGFQRVPWYMTSIFHAEAQSPDIGDGSYATGERRMS